MRIYIKESVKSSELLGFAIEYFDMVFTDVCMDSLHIFMIHDCEDVNWIELALDKIHWYPSVMMNLLSLSFRKFSEQLTILFTEHCVPWTQFVT
jgi:hypothetical protein